MYYSLPSAPYTDIEELIQAIAAVPADVTVLSLSKIRFSGKSGPELAQAFKAIPGSVTSLDLSNNRSLGYLTGDELEEIFRAIPDNVTSVDLSNDYLLCYSGKEMEQIFKSIPSSVASLDLSRNFLGEKVSQVFNAIPSSVTSLNLSDNSLGHHTDALMQTFKTIPIHVTCLNLNLNNLGINGADILKEVFQSIPKSVISLDLSNNNMHLYLHRSAEVTELFKTMAANIVTFHLSDNGFTGEQIKNLFAALGSRQDVHLDFGEVDIEPELKSEVHATNMNRSLLGHLLNHTIFVQPETVPIPGSTQAAASSTQPLISSL